MLITLLGGIGLPGGAVWVRTSFMTDRQKTIVSLAGPFMNVVLAVLLLVITRLLFDTDHLVFWAGMAFLGFLQITGALLNLLPIPGLDGYGALEPHLSPETRRAVEPVKQYAFFIFLFLFIATPAQSVLLRSRGLVLRLVRRPRRADRTRLQPHPLLVRLVLSNALRHMRHCA